MKQQPQAQAQMQPQSHSTVSDASSSARHLLREYRPLKRLCLRIEIKKLRESSEFCERQWSEEVEAYECKLEEGEDEEDTDDDYGGDYDIAFGCYDDDGDEDDDSDSDSDDGGGASMRGEVKDGETAWHDGGDESKTLCRLQEREGQEQDQKQEQKQEQEQDGVRDKRIAPAPPHEYRNHPNSSGTVTHRNMFPYHDAMYPLLDLYYHLETDVVYRNGSHSDGSSNDPNDDGGAGLHSCATFAGGGGGDDDDDGSNGGNENDGRSRQPQGGQVPRRLSRLSVPSDAPTEHTSHVGGGGVGNETPAEAETTPPTEHAKAEAMEMESKEAEAKAEVGARPTVSMDTGEGQGQGRGRELDDNHKDEAKSKDEKQESKRKEDNDNGDHNDEKEGKDASDAQEVFDEKPKLVYEHIRTLIAQRIGTKKKAKTTSRNEIHPSPVYDTNRRSGPPVPPPILPDNDDDDMDADGDVDGDGHNMNGIGNEYDQGAIHMDADEIGNNNNNNNGGDANGNDNVRIEIDVDVGAFPGGVQAAAEAIAARVGGGDGVGMGVGLNVIAAAAEGAVAGAGAGAGHDNENNSNDDDDDDDYEYHLHHHNDDAVVAVPGYMPNSAYAVFASLLPRRRAISAVWKRLDARTGRALRPSSSLSLSTLRDNANKSCNKETTDAAEADGMGRVGGPIETEVSRVQREKRYLYEKAVASYLERSNFAFLDAWETELWTSRYAIASSSSSSSSTTLRKMKGTAEAKAKAEEEEAEGMGETDPPPHLPGLLVDEAQWRQPPPSPAASASASIAATMDTVPTSTKTKMKMTSSSTTTTTTTTMTMTTHLDRFGPARLPPSMPRRFDVLLKVLRHATSELQRDHRLGRAALLLMSEIGCFEERDDYDDDHDHDDDDDDDEKGDDDDDDVDNDSDDEKEGYGDMCDDAGGAGAGRRRRRQRRQQQRGRGIGSGGVSRLRRLLSVLAAEYVWGCDWNCHGRFMERISGTDVELDLDLDNDDDDDEILDGAKSELAAGRPNHYCADWKDFVRAQSTTIVHGIRHITESHATTLAAFALMEFDGASDAAAAMDETWFEGKTGGENDEADDGAAAAASSSSATGGGGGGPRKGVGLSSSSSSSSSRNRQKTMLKQNIFYFNNTSGYGQPGVGSGHDGAAGGAGGGDGHGAGAAPAAAAGYGAEQAGKEPFRVDMVSAVVTALGWHAVFDRARLRTLREARRRSAEGGEGASAPVGVGGGQSDGELSIREAADSYLNCIRALVDIAENTVRRLPPNSLTMALGGKLVRALTLASIDSVDPGDVPHEGYLGVAVRGSVGREENGGGRGGEAGALALISPTRYADSVTYASTRLKPLKLEGPGGRNDGDDSNNEDDDTEILERILDSRPPDDVRDVVRSLFVRDLVDVKVSGCGYGDFLVWTGLPILPHDPWIFCHFSQYADEQEEQEAMNWGESEEGHSLFGDYLASRYDFTLLMLLRAWNAPWTPLSHLSFSSHHRKAIKALALCAHRYGVPSDIVTIVNSFLPRKWWPDDRRQCWCHDCQLKIVSDMIRDKVASRENADALRQQHRQWQKLPQAYGRGAREKVLPPPTVHNLAPTRLSTAADAARAVGSLAGTTGAGGFASGSGSNLQTCPGCRIAMYCSTKHRRYLWQDGHKRVCGMPPFRMPGIDEELLCRDVFGDEPPANEENKEKEEEGRGGEEGGAMEEDANAGSGEDESMASIDDDDDDDDSGDWESIDSNEENVEPAQTLTRTEIIRKFFDSKSYKLQDRQDTEGLGALPSGN